jgi:hypothetical protein
MHKNKKLLIICPFYHGSGSGVATYYQLFSKCISKFNISISIISDKEAGLLDGDYFGIFPVRCSRDRNIVKDIFSYGIQNIYYSKIFNVIKKIKPDIIIIHSSFYNHLGLFNYYISKIRKKYCGKMIADVRDQLMPPNKIPMLNIYDNVIACSTNVKNHLSKHHVNKKLLSHIPVIQEPLDNYDCNSLKILNKFNLNEREYIFYGGLIKESKGIQLLLKAFCDYIDDSNLKLVLAGHYKSRNSITKKYLSNSNVFYIGNQNRETILTLMKFSAVCVNFSFSEGMPRSCLEAMALGCNVILPKGIPEFEQYCPEFILKDEKEELIAEQINKTISSNKRPNYPIEMHYPKNVINEYLKIFW